MSKPEFSMIVAHDLNRAIGLNNKLLWRLHSDMAHFRRITAGKHVLMGTKTALSIGRALPGRTNLVMTRQNIAPYEEQLAVASLEEAREIADGDEIVCIGGGEIYSLMMPFVNRIYVTEVQIELPEADTWFPKINPAHFLKVGSTDWLKADRDQYHVKFVEYKRL